jgi:hypothetical protein
VSTLSAAEAVGELMHGHQPLCVTTSDSVAHKNKIKAIVRFACQSAETQMNVTRAAALLKEQHTRKHK